MLRLMSLRGLVLVALVAGSAGVLGWHTPDIPAPQRPRALWLWDPDPQLTDASIRAAFLDFLVRENIGTVWAQIGLERVATPGTADSSAMSQGAAPKSEPRRLTREAQWRSLLADAHRRRIRFEALDGDPTYVLEIYHDIPLGVVDAVLAFNLQGRPDERFDGIHLDNEPSQLLAWRFRDRREAVLREFLELNDACLARVHQQPGMEFGADIPYWWQSIDERTGRPIGDVEYKGVRKAASHHLIDRLDNVGIMDYRNKAEGSDGIISHAVGLLAYAGEGRRAKIWVGVETSLSTPSDVWFVVGQPSDRMDELLRDPSNGISRDGRFDDFKLRTYDDEFNTHVGLQLPARLAGGQPPAAFLAALTRLARK